MTFITNLLCVFDETRFEVKHEKQNTHIFVRFFYECDLRCDAREWKKMDFEKCEVAKTSKFSRKFHDFLWCAIFFASAQLEHRESGEREQPGDDPEADDDLAFVHAALLEVMMNG